MAFKTTEWKYSNEIAAEDIPVKEGLQYLQILSARHEDDSDVYTLFLKSLTNDAEFSVRYWLTSAEDGVPIPNARSRGTLISLGKALAGFPIGIPNPVDIVGGVVQADVRMSKPTPSGGTYPRIYQFSPVPIDIALGFSSIEQYGLEEDAEGGL